MATASEYVWSIWASNSFGTSSTTTATDTAWENWADSGTSAHTNYTTYVDSQGTVWNEWCGSYSYTVDNSGQVIYINTTPEVKKKSREEVRAEKAQIELNRIWRNLKIKELAEEKKQAEDTALVLLGEIVSPVELEHYKKYGEIVVKGKKCDYVVRKGRGVIKIAKDKVTSLCIHLKEKHKYPETDNTIAVKLLIEGDEKEFNKIANHSSMCGGDVSYWKKKVGDILEKYEESRKVA